jgi:outer membrane receptor protein involved in Fe transport
MGGSLFFNFRWTRAAILRPVFVVFYNWRNFMSTTLLREAIRRGLRTYSVAGASVAFGCIAAPALAQDAGANDQKGQSLDTIVVTGSNIRRVDIETANPVVTIDHAAIQQSGKLTLGDLVQDLPAVTGPVMNPRVNNGGGTGASTISLRGLGSSRTLVLVNGHRINNADVNSIPANAIERIEVLTDGASSVYGSDAVGGVVNFILRSNYQGAEFSTDYGISDRDDGQRQGYHFVFGQSTDKGSIMAGVDYNKFDSVLASNRAFSKNAIYYYYGTAHVSGGSSRTPTGYVQLPANLKSQFGCSTVTLSAIGVGGGSLSDYRCYNAATDNYNFQAHGNLELTPQERTNAFVLGNYKLTDNVETYLEVYHNKTQSAAQLAPQPIDTLGGPLVISAESYYNPFGVDFSNDANRFKTRSIGNGNRIFNNSTITDQVVTGFKGTVGETSWQWNAYFNYGHTSILTHTSGFINQSKIGPGIGPSYKDSTGAIVCGTDPATGGSGPIAGCTPFNIFNVLDPGTIAAFDLASGNTFTQAVSWEKSEVAEVNGSVFDLPAGTVQLAAGLSHRKDFSQTIPDATEVPDFQGVCDIGTGCVSPLSGSFSVKEIYAELLIPILKDMPFANALNLTLGDRYSRYSDFGGTNNTKFAVEYRPVEDLLLRGTVSKVFRAPTVSNLFAGAASSAPQAVDPCFGLVGTNAACVGVPGDGSFHKLPGQTTQINGIVSGSKAAGYNLTPEFGKSFDYGFVYDPHWIPGLSLSMDLWRVYLNNEISGLTAQNALNLCFFQNGGPTCALINRATSGPSAGQIDFVREPTSNLGRLDANGTDLQAHYRLPETAFGNFGLSFQTTYLKKFSDDPTPGAPGDFVQEYAGHYSTGASAIANANFSRWKALAALNWNLGPWSAAWTVKYIGKFNVGYADLNYNESACESNSPPGCELKYGATVYHNVTAGYNIEPINTRIDVGIDNLSDKQPAIMYQNNVLNGNVDPNTFDTIGRFYFARVTVKF